VVIIEAKSIQYDVMVALPQALTYMMASSQRSSDRQLFAMITNGREFCFIKLNQKIKPEDSPTYTLSRVFLLSETENQLYEVLQILKSLGQIIITNP